MTTIGKIIGERIIDFNEEGYLLEPDQWDQAVARLIGQEHDINLLTEAHWQIIEFIREFYKQEGKAPGPLEIEQATGFDLRKICNLFPSDLNTAYKMAGLPKPAMGGVIYLR